MKQRNAAGSNSMIVSSVQAPQNSVPITHNLVPHPVKIHPSNSGYPLLSTVHVPMQIPGSTSNINVQLSGTTNTMPLQIASTSLPLQMPGTTNVPVQLPAGETISVPLQIPGGSQNIQLQPQMPLLQSTNQSLGSIIHVHMGSNTRQGTLDSSDMIVTSSAQLPISSTVQVKMNNSSTMSQVQVGSNPAVVQIPNSASNSIQLTIPSSGGSGSVQLRGSSRPMPHVVYIQTPTGLKPVTSTDVITQATTTGNPPQIIVRRPVTSNSNIHLISNVSKPNIAPKLGQKTSILAAANTGQPIVIQKPKPSDKVMVPVSIAPNTQGKQAIAYLGPVKKTNAKITDNQSILISNNQTNVNNQKLFLTPMNMPKIPNTKFILPVTLPATMASKGPIINLQIANGQLQNDHQGNITVMRESSAMEPSEMPPLQPLAAKVNGKEVAPPSPGADPPYTISITGSRAEPTGEQGEYTLSIPETNASMNDDIYTVSIDDEDGQTREQSFTLSIPEKGKSLLNKNIIDRLEGNDVQAVAAPAILRRSYSDNSERKTNSQNNANVKRRISLCNESYPNKMLKFNIPQPQIAEKPEDETNDDHRVPSLFCDEKLDKDLEAKVNLGDSDSEEEKQDDAQSHSEGYFQKVDIYKRDSAKAKPESLVSSTEDDPPGLIWNNGVAQLRGSALQFQTNEFGMIDLLDYGEEEEPLPLAASAKYQTPLKQRIERAGREKKPTSPEDLYRCDGCGCHGMAAEFITPNFCSSTCQSEVQRVMQRKKDRERMELTKKRNKLKKVLLRKPSEGDGPERDDRPPRPDDDRSPDAHDADDVENEKYPWMCGKNGFSWMRYLDVCKAKAAPVKLFRDPFPYAKNPFRVGMRMEGIDPQHPALFCVVSVAEVQGYRVRLHFDGYPEVYDYWVNADCGDVFPAGWCERGGRALTPPRGLAAQDFSWPLYLKQCHAIAAPRHCFPHVSSNQTVKPHGFRNGMKLEAEDRKNELVCVATVADVLENRLLIHFDSWDEMYDYWVEPSSPYIHPVGWAEENGISLTPPNFYKDPDAFSWEAYLSETGAGAAPPRAFKTRPPAGYKVGMKLEVVDPRVPFLIRVASVSTVKGHQVKISFDGWSDETAVWLDDDSSDLHPVGWCLKTQHPLEPPLTEEELSITGPCGVRGCRGLGSSRGGSVKSHCAASACPYRAPPPPDRLQPPTPDHVLPRSRRVPAKQPKSIHTSTPNSETRLPRGRPPKHKRTEISKNEGSDVESVSSSSAKRSRGVSTGTQTVGGVVAAVTAVAAFPAPRLGTERHVAALRLPSDPTAWSQSDVAALVGRIVGTAGSSAARAAKLAGTELLMASCAELATALRLRLGPAVKLYGAVRELRAGVTTNT